MKKTSLIQLFAIALMLGASWAAQPTHASEPKAQVQSNISIFSSIIKQLNANYVDSLDMDEIVKTGIDAMLYKLDPYTEYYNTKEQREFRDRNAGEYAGIGSYITQRDGYVVVTGPHAGSPAAKAGLRHGDKIARVDGEDMKGKTTEEVSSKLKGAIGSTVKVDIIRPYTADSMQTVEMVRERISVPAVPYYGMISDDLGYIRLTQYTEKSADEVKEALQNLLATKKMNGLILDLRGNGGGYLESAVKILGYFLPKGTEVLRTRGKELKNERIYKTVDRPLAAELPLVVLTDGNTASASEITAGALQDKDRAVMIGTRTYGKGLVQSTVGLPFDGMLKVTTAKYYIPSGRLIQAVDYAHRTADGAATRIADSLTHEFTTAAGRIVRDGGGITPDIKIEYPEINRLVYNVVADNWAFDFANKYYAENPQRPDIDSVQITDTIYSQFKQFINPEKFNYDRVCETALASLRKLAEAEGYMNEQVDSQITVLEGMMKHSLMRDLDTHRNAISNYLEEEIAERYHYEQGRVKSSLRHDAMLDKAIEVLHDQQAYKAILKKK